MNKTIFVIALIALLNTTVSASAVTKQDRNMKVLRSEHDRRLFQMPESICKPASSVSKVIVESAMACAMKHVLPKSVTKAGSAALQTASKYMGALGLGKLNVIDKMRSSKHKAVELVQSKLLGALGCPVEKRRLNFWTNVKAGFYSVTSGIKSAANFVAKSANKAAKMGNKVMKKFGGIITAGACVVIKKYCEPVCLKVVDKIKGAIKALKIPEDCVKDAFKVGCDTLCNQLCAKKPLKITPAKGKKVVKVALRRKKVAMLKPIMGKIGAGAKKTVSSKKAPKKTVSSKKAPKKTVSSKKAPKKRAPKKRSSNKRSSKKRSSKRHSHN